MANLGSIVEQGNIIKKIDYGNPSILIGVAGSTGIESGIISSPWRFKCIYAGSEYMVNSRKDLTEGNPSAPSLYMSSQGKWGFKWILNAGTRTISIDCKQPVNLSPRPTLTVLKDVSLGINSDMTGTATSGTGWVTIGPVTITPTATGVVWVELRNEYDDVNENSPCYWDNIVIT